MDDRKWESPIPLRESVNFTRDFYKFPEIEELSKQSRIERRYTYVEVIDTKGGTLTYKTNNKTYYVSVLFQFTKALDGQEEIFISASSDFDTFQHLPVHLNENLRSTLDLLESNLEGTTTILKEYGVDFSNSSLSKDVINLFQTIGDKPLLANT